MEKQTLLSHLTELRTRVFWVVVCLLIGAGVGYALYEYIIQILIHPLNQTLYYTKPGGGLELMLKVCLLIGALFAVPMALFQTFSFMSPLLKTAAKLFIFYLTLCSIVLLGVGVAFSYFVALPASLKFLMEFSTENIQALITTDSYLSFVLVNLAIAALMFQLPIILIFIDRIKPLKPKKLLLQQHWVILASFVLAAIVTPTMDPVNQCLIAVPIIILYDLAVATLWVFGTNAKKQTRQAVQTVNVRGPIVVVPPKPALAVKPVQKSYQATRQLSPVPTKPNFARSIDGFSTGLKPNPTFKPMVSAHPIKQSAPNQAQIFVPRHRLIQL